MRFARNLYRDSVFILVPQNRYQHRNTIDCIHQCTIRLTNKKPLPRFLSTQPFHFLWVLGKKIIASLNLKALHTGYVLTLSKRKILDLNKLFEIDPFKQQQGQTLLLLSDPPSSLPTVSLSESGPPVLIFLKFPVIELQLCCNLQLTCWHLTAMWGGWGCLGTLSSSLSNFFQAPWPPGSTVFEIPKYFEIQYFFRSENFLRFQSILRSQGIV